MELFYRELGEGNPIVILHGLYGSSDNWMSLGRELANHYRVILVDQRNHGQSPHCPSHTYLDLAEDLYELFLNLRLTDVVLLGHSMGGKTASLFAHLYPHLLRGLIVADIVPFDIKQVSSEGGEQAEMHKTILHSLLNLNLKTVQSREELDEALQVNFPALSLRQFLLKNVKRDDSGNFQWTLNVEGLYENLEALMAPSLSDDIAPINVETLFIKGEKSPYIKSEQEGLIGNYFSNFRVESIKNAGHWLHAEKPKEFLSIVQQFLSVLNH